MNTRVRAIRIPDHVWAAVLDRAAATGQTASDVIRHALVEHITGNTHRITTARETS